jgi:hypothetical protein
MVRNRHGRIMMISTAYLHQDLLTNFVGTDFGLENIKKSEIQLRGCLLVPGVVELKNDI